MTYQSTVCHISETYHAFLDTIYILSQCFSSSNDLLFAQSGIGVNYLQSNEIRIS